MERVAETLGGRPLTRYRAWTKRKAVHLAALALLPLGVAIGELVVHAGFRAQTVSSSDWKAASRLVRRQWKRGDQLLVAPLWAEPAARVFLGDLVSLAAADQSDLSRFRRVWVMSIRNREPAHRLSTRAKLTLDRHVRGVRVRRFDQIPRVRAFDFTEQIERAKVTIGAGREIRDCPLRPQLVSPGGLGRGPMRPNPRFVCDPRQRWLWVGATILTDGSFAPRRCVYTHPADDNTIRVTYSDVPLGSELVLAGGLYWEREREQPGAPVHVDVDVGGSRLGSLSHRAGEGWKRVSFPLRESPSDTAEVAFAIRSPKPHLRWFCWSAFLRARGT